MRQISLLIVSNWCLRLFVAPVTVAATSMSDPASANINNSAMGATHLSTADSRTHNQVSQTHSAFINIDLATSMQVTGVSRYKSGGFFGIGEKEKVHHYDYRVHGSLKQRVTREESLESVLSGLPGFPVPIPFIHGSNPSSRPDYRIYRKTQIQASIDHSPQGAVFRVKMTDSQLHKAEDLSGRHSTRYWNDQTSGKITYGIKVPQGTWAVLVHQRNKKGIFSGSIQGAKLDHAVSGSLDTDRQVRSMERSVIWVRPNSTIAQSFEFENLSVGGGFGGELEISFEFLSSDNIQPLDLKTFEQSLMQINSQLLNPSTSFDEMLKDLLILYRPISRPMEFTELTKGMSPNDLANLIGRLRALSVTSTMNPHGWNIKAAALLLAHTAAYQLLSGLTPYCKQVEVELPYTGQKVNVLALSVASYLADRVRSRLHHEAYGPIDEMLKIMADFERRNLSFHQVRSNAGEFDRLYRAYEVVIQSIDMRQSAFALAHRDLSLILAQTGTIGLGKRESDEVRAYFAKAESADTQFYREFVGFLENFQVGNHKPIRAQGLRSQLAELQSMQNEGYRLIQRAVRAGNLDNQEGSSVRDIWQSIFSQHIQAMRPASSSSAEWDPDLNRLRSAYYDKPRVDQLTQALIPCGFIGVTP